MNIDLQINSVAFALGERFDSRKLTSAKCDKVGLLGRLLVKPPRGQLVYWTKNCEISCFRGDFKLWANLDRSRGPAEISGTSAYLYFKDLILQKVAFQVLSSQTMAIGETATFQTLCERAFGSPVSDSPTYWLDGESVVLCVLHGTRNKAFFAWVTRQHVDEHGLSG